MKKICFIILSIGFVLSFSSGAFAKKVTEQPALSLHEACEFGSFTEVKEAITPANINSSGDASGITPIMAACRGNSSLEIFQLLIASGAKVNAKDVNGKTPLMYAAEYDSYEKVVKELIRAGASVNAKANDGTTALMIACENNNINIIRTLINAGAKVNDRDNDGYDMSDYAQSNKKYKNEIIDILGKVGFAPRIKNMYENIDSEKNELGAKTEEQNYVADIPVSKIQEDLQNIGVEVKADNE